MPAGVEAEADTVIVDAPLAAIAAGANDAAIPVGRPVALNPTLDVNPLSAETFKVKPALAPCNAD